MNEQTKEIERLRTRVAALEAIVQHEARSRRKELKGRDREIRHLSNALFAKSAQLREAKAEIAAAWKTFRERMAAAGLDVRGYPLPLPSSKTNGVERHDTIPPPGPAPVFFGTQKPSPKDDPFEPEYTAND